MDEHECASDTSPDAPWYARRIASSLWGLTLALVAGTVLLLVFEQQNSHPSRPFDSGLIFLMIVFLAFATVGSLVATRQPRNAIGWLFCAAGFGYSVVGCARTYAIYALFVTPDRFPAGATFAWVSAWLTIPPVFLISTFLPLIFPTGRLPTLRWRPFAWLAVGGTIALTLIVAFTPGSLPNPGFRTTANPYGLPGPAGVTMHRIYPLLVLLPICALAATVSLLLRLRQSRGVEREQLKWFLSAAALVAACFGVVLVLATVGQQFDVALDITRIAFTGLPIAAGVAILWHRLWDIDVLINRALVYGTLTGCIIGSYVLIVGAVGALLQSHGSLFLSLATTGLVAVLFQPLRARLQRVANRLLWGERDNPYEVIARLGHDLERAPAAEAVLPTIVGNVARALKLPHVAIWLVDGETLRPEAVHGLALPGDAVHDVDALMTLRAATDDLRPEAFSASGAFRAALDRSGTALTFPLAHRGELVGALCLAPRGPGEEFSPADRRLLRELASHSSAATQAVQLTVALHANLDELRRSREHLIAVQEEERRRIQRDLHDGLGPTLASMRMRLEACLTEAEQSSLAIAADLEQLDELVGQATADIRRLVYDLRPPVIDQLGLLPALQQWAERFGRETGVATDLTIGQNFTVPAAAEVAVFRVAQEALVNVQKHARASRVSVDLGTHDGRIVLVVRDDGSGFRENAGWGTGLGSMRERAEMLGGSLEMASRPGGGTVLTMTIPTRSVQA